MKHILTALLLLLSTTAFAAVYRPIVLDPEYQHNRWGTQPQDHIFQFAAYTSSFDGADDNNELGLERLS
jgi:hypothetical protein